MFGDRHLRRMEEITRAACAACAACADFQAEPVELNGEANHAHPPVNHPPKIAVSKLVNSLKGVPPGVCDRSPPTWSGTTGVHNSCGPGPTPPGPSQARR